MGVYDFTYAITCVGSSYFLGYATLLSHSFKERTRLRQLLTVTGHTGFCVSSPPLGSSFLITLVWWL